MLCRVLHCTNKVHNELEHPNAYHPEFADVVKVCGLEREYDEFRLVDAAGVARGATSGALFTSVEHGDIREVSFAVCSTL